LDQPADFITLAAAGNVVTETISPGGGRLAKTVTGAVSGTNFQHLQFDFSSDADPARGTPQLTVNAGTDLSHSTVTDILINGGVQAGAADLTGLVGNYSAHHLFVTFDSNPFNIAAGDALAPSILPGVSQVLNSFGAGELDFSNTGVGAMTVDLLDQTLSGTNAAGHAITSDQNAFAIDASDTIISFAGVTGVIGGPGNDTIIMDNVGDGVQGGSGNDLLIAGAGPDKIDGGLIVPANAGVAPPGEDTVSYERSTGAVQVDLNVEIPNGTRPTGGPVKATAQHGGFAEGDSLQNVSNVTGSAFNDTLTGNAAANKITGGLGADTLTGNGPSWNITTGSFGAVLAASGPDTLVFKTAADSGVGVGNRDVITDFSLQTNATAGTVADKIDLSLLDPNHTFTFATNITASGHGEVSAHLDAASNDVVVLVDATGDGVVDMEIELQNQHALTTAIANALKADIII
jgi:Ca2+-binding RTX toxin-like protein